MLSDRIDPHRRLKNYWENHKVAAEIALAIEVGAALWRASEDLKLTEKIRDSLRGKETLLILGSTGAGKTNLIVSLNSAAGLVPAIWREDRTEATMKQNVRISQQPFRVIDTPGQDLHQSDRLREVREAAARPQIRIINVVSYGYHEYATQTSNAVTEDGHPRPEFLKRHRDEEIAALREWITSLGDRSITKWVLTAVTKADLWWDDRVTVLDHYASGEYADTIKSIDSGLQHSVLPYCSVTHRFYDKVNINGSFDDAQRIRANIHFLEQLAAMG
jgi:hypothetical protein